MNEFNDQLKSIIKAINDYGLLSFELGKACRRNFLSCNKKLDDRVKKRCQALHNVITLVQQYAENYSKQKGEV